MFIKYFSKPLKKGSKVATVAASSAIENQIAFLEGKKLLESWGLICLSNNCENRRWGYFAGKDNSRRSDLHPKELIDFFICARGGWGSSRLLENPIHWQPGCFLGFSDVTSILWARLAAGFGGCIHGPLLTTLSKEPSWSKERLKAILFGGPIEDLEGEVLVKGIAKGPLIAGNMTVATHLLGTKFLPDLNGAILVLEDVGEEPYRIDRMLTHWRLTGVLHKLSGIGFGTFKDCKDDEIVPIERSFNINEVLIERTSDLGIPVVKNLPVGHCQGNASLPLGKIAKLDGDYGRLKLTT